MSGLRDGTRIAVSGNPTAEEIAAVVVALDRGLQRPHPQPRRPGWQAAARYEAVGARVFRSAADLRHF